MGSLRRRAGPARRRLFTTAVLFTLAACSGMPSDPDAGAGVDMADLAMAGLDSGGDCASGVCSNNEVT